MIMLDKANHAKKILLICSKISNSDGIGRHALALSEQFRAAGCEVSFFTIIHGSFLDKCQQFFSKFYMRHIFLSKKLQPKFWLLCPLGKLIEFNTGGKIYDG